MNGSSAIISIVASESGGIGRRARLRGVWGDSYGFKSRLSHQFVSVVPFGAIGANNNLLTKYSL